MIRSTITTFGILVIVVSLLFSGYRYTADAAVFVHGGFVTRSFFCACSGNFLLTLSPPTPGQWVWYPGTPQFANSQLPRKGVWTLGLYSPGGVCLVPHHSGCSPYGRPIGTIGPITGTSF